MSSSDRNAVVFIRTLPNNRGDAPGFSDLDRSFVAREHALSIPHLSMVPAHHTALKIAPALAAVCESLAGHGPRLHPVRRC